MRGRRRECQTGRVCGTSGTYRHLGHRRHLRPKLWPRRQGFGIIVGAGNRRTVLRTILSAFWHLCVGSALRWSFRRDWNMRRTR